jgi:hypothetical protein
MDKELIILVVLAVMGKLTPDCPKWAQVYLASLEKNKEKVDPQIVDILRVVAGMRNTKRKTQKAVKRLIQPFLEDLFWVIEMEDYECT